MHRVVRLPASREDLLAAYLYIAQHRPRSAERFLDAAEQVFSKLARMPEIGRPRSFQDVKVANTRSYPIRGFEKWLVFYRGRPDRVEVLRVLHGARDIDPILAEELGEQPGDDAAPAENG